MCYITKSNEHIVHSYHTKAKIARHYMVSRKSKYCAQKKDNKNTYLVICKNLISKKKRPLISVTNVRLDFKIELCGYIEM